MTLQTLFASALILAFQAAPPQLPTDTGPLRNTFVVGAQTVIDNASAIDLKAEDNIFAAQLQQLTSSKNILVTLADNPRERDIADDATNMVFLINACHIQAKTGDASKCEAQLTRARSRIMDAINRHKTPTGWADGPPA